MTDQPQPRVLIAFLGTNNYVPVYYTVESARSPDAQELESRQGRGRTTRTRHEFVQSALVELLGDTSPSDVVLLVTNEARLGRRSADTALRSAANLPKLETLLRDRGCRVQPVDIPDGATEEELWAIFERLVRAIPEGAEIILDVTHGFRSLPILGVLAVAYARWARGATLGGLYYGAFETLGDQKSVSAARAKEDAGGPTTVMDAPIFDLTPMFDLTDWTEGLVEWGASGRASILTRLANEQRQQRGRQLGKKNQPLSKVAGAMSRLDGALALTRQDQIVPMAQEVIKTLAAEREQLESLPELAALTRLFDAIREATAALVPPDNVGALSSLLPAARWYAERGRFHEAASLSSELVASVAAAWAARCGVDCVNKKDRDGRPQKRGPESEPYRTAARFALDIVSGVQGEPGPPEPPFHVLHGRTPEELARAYEAASNKVRDVRNPLDHCWFGGHEKEKFKTSALDTMKSDLDAAIEAVVALVEVLSRAEPTAAPSGTSTPAGFVNLSNHPIASWPPEQLAAANALGFGAPRDYASDLLVDPAADTKAVLARARTIANAVVHEGAAAAHVAGEPVLCTALVRALSDAGVRCFAATTEREITSTPQDGGQIEVRRSFRFVRWREYG